MVLINLHRNLHEKSSFLSEIMFIRINPYLCHLLTRYQSTIFPNHKSCVRKKGVPFRHTLFLMLDGVLFHSSAAEPVLCIVIFLEAAHDDSLSGTGMNELAVFQVDAYMCHFLA